jgi:hypothetical protein
MGKMIEVRIRATDEVAHHVLGVADHCWLVPVDVLALSREAREEVLDQGVSPWGIPDRLDHEPTPEEAATLLDVYLSARRGEAQAEAARLRGLPSTDPAWDRYPCDRVREILGDEWDRVREERRLAAQAAKEAAEAEREARLAGDRAVVLAWLPEPLRRQSERGLLSDEDTRAALRDAVYPLIVPEDWPRYRRLTSSDVEHDEECYAQQVNFSVYTGQGKADLTPAEYARLEVLEAAVERSQQDVRLAGVQIEVVPRQHLATCQERECSGRAHRGTAMIEVQVGGEDLSREYSLGE